MKKLLTLLISAIALGAQAQTHVYIPLDTLGANPATNRIVAVQMMQPFRGNSTDYNTGTNTYLWLSNSLAGDWSLLIKQRGSADALQYQYTITATNLGVVSVVTNLSVFGVATYPKSAKAAWSTEASDARYASIGASGRTVAAGTNIIAVTNGNVVTIHSTATGGTDLASVTNVSAYQALIASNGLSARLILTNALNLAQTVTNTGGFATNLTVHATGVPSTKAIRIIDILGQEQFYVTDEGAFLPNIGESGGVELIGINGDGQLVKAIGNTFTNDTVANAINATNIYGAGLTQITNIATYITGTSPQLTNATAKALGGTSTKALRVLDNSGLERLSISADAITLSNLTTAVDSTAFLLARKTDGTLIQQGGPLPYSITGNAATATDAVNATNIFGAGRTFITNAAITVAGQATNPYTVRAIAAGANTTITTNATTGLFTIASTGGGSGTGIQTNGGTGINNTYTNISVKTNINLISGAGDSYQIRMKPTQDADHTLPSGAPFLDIYNPDSGVSLAEMDAEGNWFFYRAIFKTGTPFYGINLNGFLRNKWLEPTNAPGNLLLSIADAAPGYQTYTFTFTNAPTFSSVTSSVVTANNIYGTNYYVGGSAVLNATTNIIVITNSAVSDMAGAYIRASATAFTNSAGVNFVITNNAPGSWLIRSIGVGTAWYSASAPVGATWNQVDGGTPVPITRYGSLLEGNALEIRGVLNSTNLAARLAAIGAVSETAIVTQMARLTNSIGASNLVVGTAVSTNWIGNGFALTNLNATNLTGNLTISTGFVGTLVVSNFIGNGVGLTNVTPVNVITPLYYGAVGDGVEDDTSPLSTAFHALNSGTNGNVLDLCGRTYLITAELPWLGRSGITVQHGAIVTEATDMPVIMFNQYGVVGNGRSDNVTFEHLDIGRIGLGIKPTSENSVGMLIGTNAGSYNINVIVNQCRVTNFWRNIMITMVPQITISHCGLGQAWSNNVFVASSAANPDMIRVTMTDWNQNDFGVTTMEQKTNVICFQSEAGNMDITLDGNNGGGCKQLVLARDCNVTIINNESEGFYTLNTNMTPYEFSNCVVKMNFVGSQAMTGVFGSSNYIADIGLYGNTHHELNRFESGGRMVSYWRFDIHGTSTGLSDVPLFEGAGTVRKHTAYRDAGTLYDYPYGTDARYVTSSGGATAIVNRMDNAGDTMFFTLGGNNIMRLYASGGVLNLDGAGTVEMLQPYMQSINGRGGVTAFDIKAQDTHRMRVFTVDASTVSLEVSNSVTYVEGLLVTKTSTPASAAAAGIPGQWAWDGTYIYICISANTWRRVAHATW